MTITLGNNATIDASANIDPGVDLVLGDCSYIGPMVNVSGKGTVRIGDFTKVHRFSFINCTSQVTIGHNVWVGERSVLDGTGQLTIGNNVGVGVNTAIWTHVASGCRFSGCRIRSSKEVTIEDDAWLMGSLVVQASNIAHRVLVLPGSNVTKDLVVPNTIWNGNPVDDVTEAMGGPPWEHVSVEQKNRRFKLLLKQYEVETQRDWSDRFTSCSALPSVNDIKRQPWITFFETDRRLYTKRGSDDEQHFMKWLLKHNRAKFTPV